VRIGLVGNPRYAGLESAIADTARLAAERGWALSADPDLSALAPAPLPGIDPDAIDLLVTFGFLTSVARDGAREALLAFAADEHRLSPRSALVARIRSVDGTVREEHIALNDVVLHKGGVARVVRFQVLIDDEPMGPVSGDGLVIASPTGSTAYSLSAGGPVVVPSLEATVVTPICAHSLGVRPLVVRADAVIQVQAVDPRPTELLVSFDGQLTALFGPDDTLEVTRSTKGVVLVRFGEPGFFRTLRDKLQWGDLTDREP